MEWCWGGEPLRGRTGRGPWTAQLKSQCSVFQDIDLIDILWRQDIDLGAGREIFDYSHRQKEQDVDKELQDGAEQEDTWPGEGAEALAQNLLVDGETGESFPAQVLLPLPTSGNVSLEKAAWVCGVGLNVCLGLGSWSPSEGLRKREWKSSGSRGATPWGGTAHGRQSTWQLSVCVRTLPLSSLLESGTQGQPSLGMEGQCRPATSHTGPPSGFPWKDWGRALAHRQPRPRAVRLTVAVATGAWWGGPDSPVPGRVP